MQRLLRYLIPAIVVLGLHSPWMGAVVRAADMAKGAATSCHHCGVACGHGKLVPCVIMVPMEITETHMKTQVVKTTEPREEIYTVFERRPVTRQIRKTICHLEDKIQTKTITKEQCRMVTIPVVKTYTVKVPQKELRHGIEEKTICTKDGQVCVKQPYSREVTVEVPEIRSETCEVPDVVFEKTIKDISYHVKVPKIETVVCGEETVYKLFPVEKKRIVEVCVPQLVQQPVDVTVCKMVPKTIYCCPGCSTRHGK